MTLLLPLIDQAADTNEADNKAQAKSQCMLKVAMLCSQEDDFIRAASIFEGIGRESLESKLGAYSAKGYFFQSVLCYLAAGDAVAASNKMEEYKSVDYNFPSSRECQFLEKIVEVHCELLIPSSASPLSPSLPPISRQSIASILMIFLKPVLISIG
jgi:hypothetical protein